jgi:hypothetical protein
MKTDKSTEHVRGPRAFVIMPFAVDFEEVYALLKTTLEAAGFSVARADDMLSHQSILQDIVRGIWEADLIVADLTGSNPNVYYELGLAHALNKRVILLTQEVSGLPFDLRGYRVIGYDTHFARIEEARTKLRETARGALGGHITFGNPVSDYLPEMAQAPTGARQPVGRADSFASLEPEEPGFLDQVVAVHDGFSRLTELVHEISGQTESIAAVTKRAAENLTRVSTGQQAQVRQARAIVIDLGDKLNRYTEFLRERNDQYIGTLSGLRDALEYVIGVQNPTSEKEREELRTFLGQLRNTVDQVRTARAQVGGLVHAIRESPRLERTFNKASTQAALEVDRYGDNLDQTISMMVRAIEVGGARLG